MKEKVNKATDTQGKKKLIRYLEALSRNELFLKRIHQARLLQSERYFSDELEEQLQDLEEKQVMYYEEYRQLKERHAEIAAPRLNQLYEDISNEYGIDFSLIYLFISGDLFEEDQVKLSGIDFCFVEDRPGKVIAIRQGEDAPIEFDSHYFNQSLTFPVELAIHKLASKRDVLDYVEKKWSLIESVLKNYREGKPLRMRKGKYSQKLLDFIWENQYLSGKKLQNMIKAEFPETTLAYFEIYKLISLEKKKRLRKINVGH